MPTDDMLSRQTYYWGQGMPPDVPTTSSMSYTMGSQQMYSWRDVPSLDPAGGPAAPYWGQDPNQQDAVPPDEQGRHGGNRGSSRKDGGRSRR